MSSYKDALRLYTMPQLGEKRPKKKVTKTLAGGSGTGGNGSSDNGNSKANQIDGINENNSHLDIYFEIQRREHIAATRIKQCWKRSRRLIPWRKAVYTLLGIVKIQARVRGMIARHYIALWYKLRTEVVIETQARIRRILSNKHIRPILQHEDTKVRLIQRITRGWLGRRRYHRILRDFCATRIQCMWRGVTDRARADKRWLNTTVIPIQKCVRAMIARRKCQELKKVLTHAVVVIQRRFRLYLASSRISKKFFDREMQYRLNMIDMLTAEEDLCNEKVSRLMERVVKLQIKEKADTALKNVTDSEQEIYMKENALIEITKQLECLSPRAVRQGFREELTKRQTELRNELTTMKRKHIFELSKEMHQHERTFETQVKELEEWASRSKKISRWRLDEYDERRHLTYERDINERRREQRQAAANERRRWQVFYYTGDGKPDKKRRPGRPWDKSIYAGAEKATYNSACVDLLALNKAINTGKGKDAKGTGKDLTDSAEQTMEQVSLKVYLDQMRVYEEIMDPIARILQQYMGLLPQKDGVVRRMDEQGWGPIGKDMDQAMRGIGMDQIDANTRERIIGGFGKDNVLFHHEHDQITRRGVVKQPTGGVVAPSRKSSKAVSDAGSGANSVKGGGSTITSRRSSMNDQHLVVPWNGGGPQPQPSQPAPDSSFSSRNRSEKNQSNKSSNNPTDDNFFTEDDGVQSVDSYSTASLDPGSTFPQQSSSNLLRHHSSSLQQKKASSFTMRQARATTNPNASSFASSSSQRNKLTESREKDRLINTANTSSGSLLANAGALTLLPPSSSHSPSRTVSRSNSAAMPRRGSHGHSHMKLSAMFEAADGEGDGDNDHMSAITEATDELNSEQGDDITGAISAEDVYKSLRRCWKKPMKPYLPTMESFASLYAQQQELNEEEAAAIAAANALNNRNSWGGGSIQSSSGYSMSTGMLSKSSPNFFKEDKDFLAYELAKKQEEKEKKKKEKKRQQQREQEQKALQEKEKLSKEGGGGQGKNGGGIKGISDLFDSDAIAGGKSTNDDGIGDDDHEHFFRADLVTEQQKKIEANKIVRAELHEQRRMRKKKIQNSGRSATVIPWNLLDEIDGAKTRLNSEIAHIEYNHRF